MALLYSDILDRSKKSVISQNVKLISWNLILNTIYFAVNGQHAFLYADQSAKVPLPPQDTNLEMTGIKEQIAN